MEAQITIKNDEIRRMKQEIGEAKAAKEAA